MHNSELRIHDLGNPVDDGLPHAISVVGDGAMGDASPRLSLRDRAPSEFRAVLDNAASTHNAGGGGGGDDALLSFSASFDDEADDVALLRSGDDQKVTEMAGKKKRRKRKPPTKKQNPDQNVPRRDGLRFVHGTADDHPPPAFPTTKARVATPTCAYVSSTRGKCNALVGVGAGSNCHYCPAHECQLVGCAASKPSKDTHCTAHRALSPSTSPAPTAPPPPPSYRQHEPPTYASRGGAYRQPFHPAAAPSRAPYALDPNNAAQVEEQRRWEAATDQLGRGVDAGTQRAQGVVVPERFPGRESWESPDKMGLAASQRLYAVTPDRHGREYTLIARRVAQSLPGARIDRIDRVENGEQHEMFTTKLQVLRKTFGRSFDPKRMQRMLFHGTRSDALHAIVNGDNGFEPMLSGSSTGALWGEGTYFARDASYSDCYACVLPTTGQKVLLAANVLVGRACQGAPGMKIAPLVQGGGDGGATRYNTLVDNVADPSIFVVRHSVMAYPSYVITYRT